MHSRIGAHAVACAPASLPGGHSVQEPPDPISNSEVKLFSADGSLGSPHVRVGHCQAFIENPVAQATGFFFVRVLSVFHAGKCSQDARGSAARGTAGRLPSTVRFSWSSMDSVESCAIDLRFGLIACCERRSEPRTGNTLARALACWALVTGPQAAQFVAVH